MQAGTEQKPVSFIDRRNSAAVDGSARPERRQFRDGGQSGNPDVVELADAVDQYKVRHRRRFITFDELYDVIVELGYHK